MAISSPEMMLVPGQGVSQVPPYRYPLLHSLTKVDVTETTTSDLTTNTVLVAHAEVLHAVSGVELGLAVCGEEVQSRIAYRELGGHAPWSSCLWSTSLMRRSSASGAGEVSEGWVGLWCVSVGRSGRRGRGRVVCVMFWRRVEVVVRGEEERRRCLGVAWWSAGFGRRRLRCEAAGRRQETPRKQRQRR